MNSLDSDDDSAALAAINASIISLAQDNHSNNSQLISTLSELKTAITQGNTSETDLTEIVEQLKEMQKSLKYLCDVNTLDFGLDLWNELTENESKFLNEYSNLITSLISKFGLSAVNEMIFGLNSVVLNKTPPAPIVVNMYGKEMTVLSPDMFNDEAMQYINIAKIFISVLLLYSFLLMFRKKLVGGES